MNAPLTPIRHHAVSMQLAAYLDGRYVEMLVLTDTGKSIAIACDKNSILAIERHIQQLGRECPEISTWKTVKDDEGLRGRDQSSYEAARRKDGLLRRTERDLRYSTACMAGLARDRAPMIPV